VGIDKGVKQMNKCEYCEKQFSYWQVWRSFWSYRLDCPSCGKRNPEAVNRRFFPSFVIIGIPLLVSGQINRYFNVLPFVTYVAMYLSIAFLLSLLVPKFKLYGEKESDSNNS
jgi:CXXC-20-CXXC protein